MTRPTHKIECPSCGRALMTVTVQNATKFAMQCKCDVRLTLTTAQDGSVTPSVRKRDQPPSWFLDQPTDADTLRESAIALRSLRTARDSLIERVAAIDRMREPVMSRERDRLIQAAQSVRVLNTVDGDPMRAILAVLEHLDPDTATAMMQRLMEKFQAAKS